MATDQHDTVTTALPTPAAGPQMRMVEVALIEESLTNPRKTFDATKLQELADSIKASGVHQPILLRPLPGTRLAETFGFRRQGAPLPAYELVAGARRLRACRLAKVAEVPAMIRELTDDQALEIQLIENLQRVDMSELEEAEGYRALMEHSHLTVEQVAEKIGKGDSKSKGKSYVYARLKLLDLFPEATQALRDGAIDASRALRIARIPDAKLQAKALAEASRKGYRGDPAMGVREFEGWLQQNVMLRLDSAPFNITAIELVPAAGSCKDCPKRTGANPDLFADVNSPDLCTDPACYHGKEAAHSTALRAQAEAKGMRVIDGKEAKGIVKLQSWDGHGNKLDGYTRLDTIRHDVTHEKDRATLRELLGDKGPQPVLIEHPTTKELIEAVPTEEAEAVLVQRGVLKTTVKQINLEERISQLKQQSAHRQARAAATALQSALTQAALKSPQPAKVLVDAELLREWLKLKIKDLDQDDLHTVFSLETIEDENYQDTEARATARIDRASDGEVRNYMLAWVITENAYRYGHDDGTPLVTAAARALCIDAHDVEAQAVAREKEELAEAIANLRAAAKAQAKPVKAAAPKTASTPNPAAQAIPTREGGKAKGAKGKTTPAAQARATAPKTTKAEAAAQIAAALAEAEGNQDQAPAAHGNEGAPAPAGGGAGDAAPSNSAAPVGPSVAWPFPNGWTEATATDSAAAPAGEAGADAETGATVEGGEALVITSGMVLMVKDTCDAVSWRGRTVTVTGVKGASIKARESNKPPAHAERGTFFAEDLEALK
ncbi:ParB/RepB/Spo0J family partition protein [Acidovorax sp. LjRoot74]|uniref:ParB/RepB/Spo0J family partition protein n=1 Tax=Acidovorax sp. LjRoot74 TaxID=3342337 RepID=UPI003ECE4D9B